MGIAAAAMRAAENQMSATAERIVQINATPSTAPIVPVEPSQPTGYQTVHVAMPTADLAQEMANLKQAELGFRAGVAVFKAANRMTRRTLDILA